MGTSADCQSVTYTRYSGKSHLPNDTTRDHLNTIQHLVKVCGHATTKKQLIIKLNFFTHTQIKVSLSVCLSVVSVFGALWERK